MEISEIEQHTEGFGLLFEQMGLTRMSGRILGWMLVCDPPAQTMEELVRNLKASKSSVSTTTRQLIQMGFIERLSKPGERKDYFKLKDDVWNNLLKSATEKYSLFFNQSKKSLDLLSGLPKNRLSELIKMKELFEFFLQEVPKIIQTWEDKQL